MHTTTVYRTYVEGRLAYSGPDLATALRSWDLETHALGRSVAGGVAVATYSDEAYGMLQLRDGWLVHVLESGTVYVSPSLAEVSA